MQISYQKHSQLSVFDVFAIIVQYNVKWRDTHEFKHKYLIAKSNKQKVVF